MSTGAGFSSPASFVQLSTPSVTAGTYTAPGSPLGP